MNEKEFREKQGTFMEIWGFKPTKRELESLEIIGKKMKEKGII